MDAPAEVAEACMVATAPFFDFAEASSSEADFELKVRVSGRRKRARKGKEVRLHGEMVGLLVNHGADVGSTVETEFATYHVSTGVRPTVELIYDGTAPVVLDVLRLVRGVLTAYAEAKGLRKLHGACVKDDSTGIMFVGDSGAGKTSFALTAVRRGALFLANDKVLLNDQGTAFGIPLAVATSVDALPDLGIALAADARIIDGKWYEWPEPLAEMLGSTCISHAAVDVVAVCQLDLAAADVSVSVVNDADRVRWLPALTIFTDRIHPDWLVELLGLRVERSHLGSLFDRPWLRLRGNPWCSAWSLSPLVSEVAS